jgi:hypothetical protein
VLRSDLTPIPVTIEIEVRDTPDTASMREGALFKAGRDQHEFLIVKRGGYTEDGYAQAGRNTGSRTYIGLLASCAPIAEPLQRAVIRYGGTFGEAYRASGARAVIGSDIPIPVFVCMRGLTPSFEIAKALVEAGGALVVNDRGGIDFKRLGDLTAQKPVVRLREDSAEQVQSGLLERHTVPFAFSTDRAGLFVTGRSDAGRGITYRPRGTTDILNAMRSVPIVRRKVSSGFAPHIRAGDCIDVGANRYFVVTAAHTMETNTSGNGGAQTSTIWLAQVAA